MERAFDTNTRAFSDGIQMLELRQTVLFQVMQDLFVGGQTGKMPHTKETPEGLRLDFDKYFAAALEQMQKTEEKPAEAPPALVAADDEAPHIFGGDHA